MSDVNPAGPTGRATGEEESSKSPFVSGKSVFLGASVDTRAGARRALAVLIGGLALTALVIGLLSAQRQREQARDLAVVATRHTTDLQTQILQAASALYTPATWVLQNGGDVPRFELLATALLPAYRGVAGLDLAPNSVVTRVAPAALLRPLLGRNLTHDPLFQAAASQAVVSRNIYFSGPTLLGPDTPVLTVRLPVFVPDGTGGTELWGLIGGYLRLDTLVQGARLGQLPAIGYEYSLTILNEDGSTGALLAGLPASATGAEQQTLRLPGLSVRLAIWPRGQASPWWWIAGQALLGLALSGLAAALVGTVARRRQASTAALQAIADSGRANERFAGLIEAIPEALVLSKSDGRIVLANTRTETLLGHSRGELLGRPLSQLLPALATTDEQGQGTFLIPNATETVARRKDGSELTVTTQSGRLAASGPGEPLFCHLVHRRIDPALAPRTPEPKPAAAVKPGPDLFAASPAAHLLLRGNAVIEAANPAAAELLAVATVSELRGRPLAEFLTETVADGARSNALLEQQIERTTTQGGTTCRFELAGGAEPAPVDLHLVQLADDPEPLFLAALRDQRESRRLTQDLAANRQQLHAVVAGLRDWESWMGLDGQPLWIGGQVQAFTGCTAEECLAMQDYPLGLVLDTDFEAVREALLSALQGTSGNNLEFRVRRKDGQIRRVALAWRPVFDDRRRPLGYRMSIREAGRAVAVPEPVRPEKDTVELALDNAEIGVWDWNLANGQNVWDERMLRLFGLTPEDFGRSHDAWRKRLHPEDLERLEAALQAALQADGVYEVEHRVVLPDGQERSLASRGRVIRDERNEPSRIIGATWDTTPLRQAEEELRQRHALMRGLLDASSSLVQVKDAEGRYLLANQAWCDFFQVQPQNLAGRTDAELLPPALAAGFAEQDRVVRETLQPHRSEETLTVAGTTRKFLCDRFPLLDGGERLQATVMLATDISDLNPPGADDAPAVAPPDDPPEPTPMGPKPSVGSRPKSVAEPVLENPPPGDKPEPPKPNPPVPLPNALVTPTGPAEEARRPVGNPGEMADRNQGALAEETGGIESSPPEEPPSFLLPTTETETRPSGDDGPAKPRRAAKKRRPKPEALGPQDLLPGFPPPPPAKEPEGAATTPPPIPGIDFSELQDRLGLNTEQATEKLLQFAASQRRLLTGLRDALEDGDETGARKQAQDLAESAGVHAAEEVRRLAKTVELAIRYRESHLASMVTELETVGQRLSDAIEQFAATDHSGSAKSDPALPPIVLELLDHLIEALEEEEADTSAEVLEAIAEQAVPDDLRTTLREINDLVAEAELPDAAALSRGLRARLG